MNKSSNLEVQPQSMTGYAVISVSNSSFQGKLHLKSVNNRYLELKWRAPKNWLPFEVEFKNSLKENFGRGSFEFWVEESSHSNKQNQDGAQNYFRELSLTLAKIKGVSELKIPNFVRALILVRQPELWLGKQQASDTTLEELTPHFQSLIHELKNGRRKEGSAIIHTIGESSLCIRSYWKQIQEQLPILRKDFEEDSKLKLQKLFESFNIGEIEQNKITSEVALQIDRRDCSEEMQRIDTHLNMLDVTLAEHQQHIGKKLDFIAQELNREWTTLGSKVRTKDVFQVVLNAKLEIEKIREQCLNLA